MFFYYVAIDLISRSTATSMDKQRKEHIAYEYLCHLEEAKKYVIQTRVRSTVHLLACKL